jgi:putative two-component system response regulator
VSELSRPDGFGRPHDGLDASPAVAGPEAFHDNAAAAVPKAALFLSLAAFVVPLVGATVFDAGLLPWIAALIPAFLLSYYKGWAGSAATLATGMALIPVWVLILWWLGRPEPSWDRVLLLVTLYLVVCVGLGVVTEALHRARRSAERGALTDAVTGLPNRQHLEVLLSAAIGSARASRSSLSVLMLDVDQFELLVDTHGREAGDGVMAALADLLRSRAGPDWLCARSGEHALVAVLPRTSAGDATRVGESLRAAIDGLGLRWQPLKVSAGVATVGGSVKSAERLLAIAEAAVRSAAAERERVHAASGMSVAQQLEDAERQARRSVLPRALVALPDPAAESVRRVLELNGLRVDVYERAADLAADEDREGRPTILVTAASRRSELGDVLWEIDRALDPTVTRVIFLEDLKEHEPTPRVVGTTILRGTPSGERLLPLIGGLLANGAKAASSSSSIGGFASKLAQDDVPLTAGRIMVVEDDAATSTALRRALQGIGFQDIVVLNGGEAALAAVVETPPDLMILDLHMPGIDGFAVLEALRPLLTGNGFLPVLVVTGDQLWEHRQRALRIGAKDFLNKPFDVAELGARVLNLLETRKLHLQMRDSNELLEVRVRDRTRQLGLAKDEILFRLARAAEYRDDVTGRHAERVGVAAALLGEGFGLSAAACETLRRSAPLHDVGKIGIPDAILLKPGKLTTIEMQIMRRHTIIGADLLANSTSEIIEDARVVALTHHERWDGSGYPQGLSGMRIPIQGRLVALADALDALTHERPYKRAVPFEEAAERLVAEAGTAFDPAVVEALKVTAFRIRDVLLDPSPHPTSPNLVGV